LPGPAHSKAMIPFERAAATSTVDDDDVYLRLQHGKGFHNLVYISYVNT
jgi:hypothetical protein